VIGAVLSLALLAAPYERAPLASGDVDWIERPSAEQLSLLIAHHMPDGKITLTCTVLANGRLAECVVYRVESDDPRLVDTAMKIAPLFRMQAVTRSGEATAGRRVRLPLVFKTADPESPAQPPAAEPPR
jgi:hypothetical protein